MKTNSRLWILLGVGAILLIVFCCAAAVVLGAFAFYRSQPMPTPSSELEFSPVTLPDARVDEPYSVLITVSNNDTPVFDIGMWNGTLPQGLEFTYIENTNTAEISGEPLETGTFTFEIGAMCFGTNVSGQVDSHSYTLVVE
ncbi:MAG: hypothetical protein RBT75_00880 [Anaerolineae bacterium]|jgi:hypothetical protein|nr:hypothetical protein [Anaerolineae bacterium]